MISKNKIKYIHSLAQKKNRDADSVFVAEGPKVVADLLTAHPENLVCLVAIGEWLSETSTHFDLSHGEVIEVSDDELKKASLLCHPQKVLAVFRKFCSGLLPTEAYGRLSIMLDGVQDPGNLGTIIRIADWFGIENVICSPDTADVYNPKVVQATMGSIVRVAVDYMPLVPLLESAPEGFPVYGTLLEGENMYAEELTSNGFIIFGNEGNGLSPIVRRHISRALRIPNFPEGRSTADSLNVAVATAIVCSEFRRQQIKKS